MLAVGCWLPAVGYWLMAVGCWLLVDCWLMAVVVVGLLLILVVGMPLAVGDWESEHRADNCWMLA